MLKTSLCAVAMAAILALALGPALPAPAQGGPLISGAAHHPGLPIIRIQNLNGSRDFHRFPGRPNPRWTVESGDLLFAWAGVRGSSFGPRLWSGPKGVLNQHIFRLRPVDGVVKVWLFEALKLVTREIEERAHGFKSSLLHLRKRDLLEHRVAVPPLPIQRWIASRSESLAEIAAADLHRRLDGAVLGEIPQSSPLHGRVDGVLVSEVDQRSPAWAVGLRPGDVITAVNRQPVASLSDFQQAIGSTGVLLMLHVMRGNGSVFILVQ